MQDHNAGTSFFATSHPIYLYIETDLGLAQSGFLPEQRGVSIQGQLPKRLLAELQVSKVDIETRVGFCFAQLHRRQSFAFLASASGADEAGVTAGTSFGER